MQNDCVHVFSDGISYSCNEETYCCIFVVLLIQGPIFVETYVAAFYCFSLFITHIAVYMQLRQGRFSNSNMLANHISGCLR